MCFAIGKENAYNRVMVSQRCTRLIPHVFCTETTDMLATVYYILRSRAVEFSCNDVFKFLAGPPPRLCVIFKKNSGYRQTGFWHSTTEILLQLSDWPR